MLILARNVNERIRINDDIVITIVEAMKDKVRLGFEAPKSVSIHREEVYERIHSKPLTKANENQ